MTAVFERPPKFGQPRITLHLEAESDLCCCERLAGCGGIVEPYVFCAEHGGLIEMVKYHSHPVQARQLNRGRHL